MPNCQDCGNALNDTETRLCAGCKWQRNHEAEKRAMYVHYLGFDPEEEREELMLDVLLSPDDALLLKKVITYGKGLDLLAEAALSCVPVVDSPEEKEAKRQKYGTRDIARGDALYGHHFLRLGDSLSGLHYSSSRKRWGR